LRFTWIAHALPDESVEIKQWRTTAADCVYVVFVIKQVEDLHFGDDLEPLSKVKWSCRPKIKCKVAVILAKEISPAVDVRSAWEFGNGHVPDSLNIGLGGQFAIWAGSLISMGTPIVIVAASDEQVDEAVMRLARVGIETVTGYLHGGIDAWREAGLGMAHITQISVEDLHKLIEKESDLQILDVRRPPEYESGHVPHALHAPLSTLQSTVTNLVLDSAKPTAVICAGGYRSSAATSILQQQGFANLLNVTGGTTAWISAGYEVEMPSQVVTS